MDTQPPVLLPAGFCWDRDVVFGDETMMLSAAAGINFLTEASDIEENPLQFSISRDEIPLRFPISGIRRENDRRLIAYVSLSRISMDLSREELPEDGWQSVIRASYDDGVPTGMALWVALVDSGYRKLGLSEILLHEAKRITRERGFLTLIGPVRPTHKSEFPELSIEEYLAKKSDTAQIYDPWLRAHVRNGAEILNVCSDSVVVRASVKKWESWTGQRFSRSGPHQIAGGLVSLEVDLSAGIGIYREPNIWVRYKLGELSRAGS